MYFKRFKVFYGWWIVAALLVIGAYIGGITMSSFTAIFQLVTAEFKWSYTQVSLAASLRSLETGVFAPVIGLLVKRMGARKLVFAGVLISCLGLVFLSYTSSLAWFYAAYIISNVGMSACCGVVAVAVVGNWFRRRVSLATSIVLSTTALGGLTVPLVTRIVDDYTWRTAMLIFGLAGLIIFLPLSLIIRNSPEQYGYSPDGQKSDTDDSSASPQDIEPDIQAGNALRSRAFWQITIGVSFMFVAILAVTTHIMPYLSTIDINRSNSSLIAGALPVVSVCGRLGYGWLGDKYDRKRLTVIACTLVSFSVLLFCFVSAIGTWLLIPFIIFFSIGWGGCTIITPILLKQYFGRANLGTIYGFTVGSTILMSMIGPPLAGWLFDYYGDYQNAWFVSTCICVLGSICVATIPRISNGLQVSREAVN